MMTHLCVIMIRVLFSAVVVVFFHGFAASSFIFIGLTASGFAAAGECGGFTTFDNKIENKIEFIIRVCSR